MTPLLLMLLALSAPSQGAVISPWPSYVQDDFIGPLTPEQEAEREAYKLSQQQQALNTVSGGCVPWHPPCKVPEEADKTKLEAEGTVPNEGFVQVGGSWSDCTSGVCKLPTSCAENPGMAPCKAAKDKKEKEKAPKAPAPKTEYEKANERMWGGAPEQGQTGSNSFSLMNNGGVDGLSGNDKGTGVPAVDPFEVDGAGAGDEDEAGIRSIADDVLDGQPDNSPLFAGDSGGKGYGEGNVGLGAGLNQIGARFATDNGDDVSLGSPTGSYRPDPSKAGTSSIARLNKMSKPATTGGSNDTITSFLESLRFWDRGPAAVQAPPPDPTRGNTNFFGTQKEKTVPVD